MATQATRAPSKEVARVEDHEPGLDLRPPDSAGLVPRPRLNSLADAHRGGALWVSGPAGSGKSSFLAIWCHAIAPTTTTVWYHVDASDMDVAAFFAGLSKRTPRAQALPPWSLEHGLDPAGFARRFFAAWFDALDPAVVVVLDDVHDAAASPAFRAVLDALVRTKPKDATVVMGSREVPAGQLLAVAAHPRFASIGWPELRCTDDEARALAQAWSLPPPSLELLALVDGWIAALVIMLRYPALLPAREEGGLPPAADVFAAVAGSAFARLPERERGVLLLGAFAPRFDAAAIASASGIDDVHALLEATWRRHSFMERRTAADGSSAYVGHPLLRAFLQARAHEEWTRDVIDREVRALAAAFCDGGDLEAAAATCESIDAWDAYAPLFLAQCPGWLESGQLATVAEGLRKLDRANPAGIAAWRPALDGWRGIVATFEGDASALDWLERSHHGHLARGEATQALLTVVARMDAYFLLWEQWRCAAAWADELERLFDMVGDALPRPLLIRVLSCGASMMFPCSGHRLVARFAEQARAIVTTTSDPHEQLALAGFVIGHGCWMGAMNTVREVALIAAGATGRARVPPSRAIQTALWVVVAEHVDGRAADARIKGFVERSFELAERHDLKLWRFHCWLQRSGLASSLSDPDAANAACEEGRRLSPGHRGARQMVLMGHLLACTNGGAWQSVVEMGESAIAESADLGGDIMLAASIRLQLAAARVMLGTDAATVQSDLAAIEEQARRTGSHYLHVMTGLVHAALALRLGDDDEGRVRLSRALARARGAGFRHLHPAWSIPFYRPLLAHALDAGIEVEWVRELIRVQRVPPPPEGHDAWPMRVRIRVLGGFDVRVDDRSVVERGKGKQPVRVFELLSFLALHGHEPVKASAVADALWAGAEGDTGAGALVITVHRARKLLDEPASIVMSNGLLHLEPDMVAVDVVELGRTLRHLGRPLAADDDGRALLAHRDRLLAAYTGAPRGWNGEAVESKLVERLHHDLVRAARELADALAHAGMRTEAAAMQRELAERDPRLEPG